MQGVSNLAILIFLTCFQLLAFFKLQPITFRKVGPTCIMGDFIGIPRWLLQATRSFLKPLGYKQGEQYDFVATSLHYHPWGGECNADTYSVCDLGFFSLCGETFRVYYSLQCNQNHKQCVIKKLVQHL